MLGSTGELQNGAGVRAPAGEPLGHLLSVVELKRNCSPIRSLGCSRVLGMSSVDELKAAGVLGGEGR